MDKVTLQMIYDKLLKIEEMLSKSAPSGQNMKVVAINIGSDKPELHGQAPCDGNGNFYVAPEMQSVKHINI